MLSIWHLNADPLLACNHLTRLDYITEFALWQGEHLEAYSLIH